MPAFVAVTDQIPPTVGHPRKLWSPDLFDGNTGDYPISPLPATIHYPVDGNGKFSFFQKAVAARVWPTSDSGGGGYAWDEQDHVPPDFSTYYTESGSLTYPPDSASSSSKTFFFNGNVEPSILNPIIKMVFDLHGSANCTGIIPFVALAAAYAEILYSLDGGSTFSSAQLINWFQTDEESGPITYDSTKLTGTVNVTGNVDLSLFQVKVQLRFSATNTNPGESTVSADLDVYALYCEPA